MPPTPDPTALTALYWVVGSLLSLGAFVAILKKAEVWGKKQVIETVQPDLLAAMKAAITEAFAIHAKEEKEWRDQERKEWREGLESLRREFRELERDLRQQLRQLEQDIGRMSRPALRKDDLEKLENMRDFNEKLMSLSQLIDSVRSQKDEDKS
jgi:hypothetical protein